VMRDSMRLRAVALEQMTVQPVDRLVSASAHALRNSGKGGAASPASKDNTAPAHHGRTDTLNAAALAQAAAAAVKAHRSSVDLTNAKTQPAGSSTTATDAKAPPPLPDRTRPVTPTRANSVTSLTATHTRTPSSDSLTTSETSSAGGAMVMMGKLYLQKEACNDDQFIKLARDVLEDGGKRMKIIPSSYFKFRYLSALGVV